MKYQYYVLGKWLSRSPPQMLFRAGYVPVELQDGKRVVCGSPIDLSHMEDASDCASHAADFLDIDPESSLHLERAQGIDVPEGWELMADFPLPDNYVPESQEVREESEKRTIDHLRKMGVWRD